MWRDAVSRFKASFERNAPPPPLGTGWVPVCVVRFTTCLPAFLPSLLFASSVHVFSNFDCDYAFTLGGAVASLMHRRVNGYLATVTGLKEPVAGWKVCGVQKYRCTKFMKMDGWAGCFDVFLARLSLVVSVTAVSFMYICMYICVHVCA